MSVIGLRVGPFEIVQRAQMPGPGPWYVARRSGMTRKQPAAVLVRLLDPNAQPEARAELQRAFEALKGLDDPRIPSAVAFYEGSGALAIQHVDGTALTALVAARLSDSIPMTPTTLLDILLELTESLLRAHRRQRVHGHIEPDNVWLAPDGQVWMLGWERDPGVRASDPWVAPERARGEPLSPATDQWSLAALATSLITGRVPWPEESPLASARNGDPTPLVEPVERQWPALGRLLRRMLDPHAANRFPTLHPVRQELLGLARKAGGTSDRRELGARLSRERPTLSKPAPEPEPPAADEPVPVPVPASERPTSELPRTEWFAPPADPEAPTADHTPPDGLALATDPDELALDISEEAPTPLAPARRVEPLPSEPIPVVRPDFADDTDVPVAARTEPPSEAEQPTVDLGESVSELLDRLATESADVEASEETVMMRGSTLGLRGDDEETVMYPPGAIQRAMADDAVLIDGGAPTAIPATDSGEPTDPGLAEPELIVGDTLGRREPGLAHDGDQPLPPASVPSAPSAPDPNPQRVAVALVAVLALLFLVWVGLSLW